MWPRWTKVYLALILFVYKYQFFLLNQYDLKRGILKTIFHNFMLVYENELMSFRWVGSKFSDFMMSFYTNASIGSAKLLQKFLF